MSQYPAMLIFISVFKNSPIFPLEKISNLIAINLENYGLVTLMRIIRMGAEFFKTVSRASKLVWVFVIVVAGNH
jgi:hypothetical protein